MSETPPRAPAPSKELSETPGRAASRKVITYGTFDLFHVGHVRLLQRLADLGDHLTVCVSTDAFNAIKGKHATISYQDRAEIVAACSYVDCVLPENDWQQKRGDIIAHGIDIFAMGDDWIGKFDHLSDLCEVVYLPRTEEISTTSLRAYLGAQEAPKADVSAYRPKHRTSSSKVA